MKLVFALVIGPAILGSFAASAQGIPNRSGVQVQGSQSGNLRGAQNYRSVQGFRRDWNVYQPDPNTTVFVPKAGSYPPGQRPKNIYVPKNP
jgi:hypothetical protein